MKTKWSGSSEGWRRMKARRFSATLGRSCSAACRLFFERGLLRPQEPPQARQPHRDPVPGRQRAAQLLQGQIRLLGQQLQYRGPVLDQARAVVAPHRARLRMTFHAQTLRPTNRRADADSKSTRRRSGGGARTHRRRHAPPQVPRIWCRHIVPQRHVASPLSPIPSRLKLFIFSNLPDRKPL